MGKSIFSDEFDPEQTEAIHTETGLIIPEDMVIDLLETSRSCRATYRRKMSMIALEPLPMAEAVVFWADKVQVSAKEFLHFKLTY